jgi:hypothetical protein
MVLHAGLPCLVTIFPSTRAFPVCVPFPAMVFSPQDKKENAK